MCESQWKHNLRGGVAFRTIILQHSYGGEQRADTKVLNTSNDFTDASPDTTLRQAVSRIPMVGKHGERTVMALKFQVSEAQQKECGGLEFETQTTISRLAASRILRVWILHWAVKVTSSGREGAPLH